MEAQNIENEGDALGFKRAMGEVSDWCTALYCYISWDAGVVKTLLTKTTLALKFDGSTTGGNGRDQGKFIPTLWYRTAYFQYRFV
jgi:hypothetical protein